MSKELPGGDVLLSLARAALRRPGWVILASAVLTAFFAAGLGRLELRTDGAAIYPRGNLAVRQSRQDRERFREPENQVILLVSASEGGPALSSPEGLAHLAWLHAEIDRMPAVESGRVRSLASLPQPPAAADSPYVHDFLETIPRSPAELRRLLRRLRDHPLVHGLFLSEDGRAAALYVPLAEGDRLERLAALERGIRDFDAAPFKLRLTGAVMAEARLGESVLHDLTWLTPRMAAVVVLLLFASLRTVGAVAVAMIEVLAVLVWVLGAMSWCGVPVTLVTTVLPVILMATAVTDEIHVLERFQAHLARTGVREAMEKSLDEIHSPVVLTSLSTALAFLSFCTASIEPLVHFGAFTALGIVLAMVATFTLVPALAALLPPRSFEPPWPQRRAAPGPSALGRWIAARPGRAAILAAALVLALLPGTARLEVQDSWIENFDPGSELAAAERDYNARFWGSYSFDLVLEATEEGYFRRPEGLARVEEIVRRARRHPDVGGLVTHLVPYRIVAEAWGEDAELSALPPATLRRVAAWVRVLRHRVDLDQYVTDDGRTVRVRLLVPSSDYRKGQAIARHLRQAIDELQPPAGFADHASGHLPVAVEVVRAIVGNQLRSIAWTALAVAVLLAVSWRSALRAAVTMGPVLAATAMVLGVMGYAGKPLGIATSMFAALTLGVGVDFALHFSHRYRAERQRSPARQAALATLASAGRSIRWNTCTLAVGFLVLSFSALKPNHDLGLLLATALAASYLVTLLALPWLLERLHGARGRAWITAYPFRVRRNSSSPSGA